MATWNNYGIHSCIILSLCLIITFTIFTTLIRKLRKNKISLFAKCALISIMFSILFMVQKICLWFYSSSASRNGNFNHDICWIVPFTNQYLGFNKICIYFYFIVRLHKIFHNSAMAYSKKSLYLFAIIMIASLTISTVYVIFTTCSKHIFT